MSNVKVTGVDCNMIFLFLLTEVSKTFKGAKTKEDWLELYLVYLFRSCEKDANKFRLLIGGQDEGRAYIFRPDSMCSLFWKLVLVTLGHHRLRFWDFIRTKPSTGGRFICMNLKPIAQGKIFLDEDNKHIPHLKGRKILEILNNSIFIKSVIIKENYMRKCLELKMEEFQKEVSDEIQSTSLKNTVDAFLGSFMNDKTLMPSDYSCVKENYRKWSISYKDNLLPEDQSFRDKFWVGKVPKEKKDGAVQDLQWCIRYHHCHLYEIFYSHVVDDKYSTELFIKECNFSPTKFFSIGSDKAKEEFALLCLEKVLQNTSAVWAHNSAVKPKFFFLLHRLVYMASCGYWKMKNEHFEKILKSALDDKKGPEKQNVPLLPFVPVEEFEQLGVPLLHKVLYKTEVVSLKSKEVEEEGVKKITFTTSYESPEGGMMVRLCFFRKIFVEHCTCVSISILYSLSLQVCYSFQTMRG